MSGRSHSAGALFALLLVAAVHLALGRAANHVVGADDDRLWLYFTGATLLQDQQANELQRRVAASMQARGVHENDIVRIDLRRDYHHNYLAASVVYRAAEEAVAWAAPSLIDDYPSYVARALYSGFVAAYALTALGVGLAAWFCGSRRIATAVGVSIALTGLLEAIFDLTGNSIAGGPMLLPRAGDRAVAPISVFLKSAFGLVADPGIAFSVFGDTPRNHFLLATVAVFALRWAGRYQAAAVVLLGLSFLHQSMTGLLFVSLLACDLLLRPQIFSGLAARLIAVLTLMLFLTRETLAPYVAYGSSMAAFVLVLVGAGLAFTAAVSVARRQPAWLVRLVDRIRGPNDEWSDVRVLLVIWLVSIPPVALANAFVGTNASLYFWAQVHGRLLAILRPMLVLAAAVWLVSRSAEPLTEARSWRLVAVCAAAVLPGAWLAAGYMDKPVSRLREELRAIDARLGPSLDWSAIGTHGEDAIYYGLARAIDRREVPDRAR